jgi:hypothetical protein
MLPFTRPPAIGWQKLWKNWSVGSMRAIEIYRELARLIAMLLAR